MNESITDKLKKVFIPSLVTGATAAGLLLLLDGQNTSSVVNFLGMEVPAYGMIAGAATIGNMAGEVLTDVVLPYAERGMSKDVLKIEDMVIPPALSGLSTYGAVRFLTNLQDVPLMNVGLLGAGSSVVGNYIYNAYEKK